MTRTVWSVCYVLHVTATNGRHSPVAVGVRGRGRPVSCRGSLCLCEWDEPRQRILGCCGSSGGVLANPISCGVYPIYPQNTRHLPPKCQRCVRCSRHGARTFLCAGSDGLPGTCLSAGTCAPFGQRTPVTDHRSKRIETRCPGAAKPGSASPVPRIIHA
jgi:hypothetical protein